VPSHAGQLNGAKLSSYTPLSVLAFISLGSLSALEEFARFGGMGKSPSSTIASQRGLVHIVDGIFPIST